MPNAPCPTTLSSSKSEGPTLGAPTSRSELELAVELLVMRLCSISATSLSIWAWSRLEGDSARPICTMGTQGDYR